MLTIQIQPCAYHVFSQIRDAIFEMIPFALLYAGYSKDLEMAVFQFWDSRYVPESLKGMAMSIPGNNALVEKLDEKIIEVLGEEVQGLRLKRGQLWYLAHPYTKYWKEEDRELPPREHNFREVNEIAGKLLDRGIHIYSPISHTHPIWATQDEMSLEEEYEMYLGLDKTIARRCTGLILCEGWETSRGCKEEKKWFEAWGKPIRYVDGEGVDL